MRDLGFLKEVWLVWEIYGFFERYILGDLGYVICPREMASMRDFLFPLVMGSQVLSFPSRSLHLHAELHFCMELYKKKLIVAWLPLGLYFNCMVSTWPPLELHRLHGRVRMRRRTSIQVQTSANVLGHPYKYGQVQTRPVLGPAESDTDKVLLAHGEPSQAETCI